MRLIPSKRIIEKFLLTYELEGARATPINYAYMHAFMKSKHDCLVITMHWNGRIESRRYSEREYRKLLEKYLPSGRFCSKA